MRLRRVVTLVFILGIIGFGIYLQSLYQQLRHAFIQQDEFVPTRIYSDVSRIAPPAPRAKIEERLKSLQYSTEVKGGDVSFTLHAVDYPFYLVPDGHPTLEAYGKQVILHFDREGNDALLQSIEVAGQEVPEIYLEPEIVAVLSRGGAEGNRNVRDIVKFDDIPAQVVQAFIAIEDQHFLDHNGLDPRGVARAILVNLRTLSFAQGGSTITQQLVKNLMARRTKNFVRKVNEVFLALLLEATFDKNQILERYLNEVYLGQIGNLEVHGVAEGAKYFFGKRLSDLNLGEIALMAGLIRGPGYYSPYRYRERALERQRLVLKKMVETGHLAEGDAKDALSLPIQLAPPQTVANKAPYFVDFVKAELIRHLKDRSTEQEITQAGYRVYTTLDLGLNSEAQRSLATGIDELEKKVKPAENERLEGALATVDHKTGYIRALVGGRNYARSTFNRILNMKRQVGSTFKPVVYLAALEKGEDPKGIAYGPGHPAEDSPWKLVFDRGKQSWAPRNYEKEYRGWISYRQALAHSINTVAAKLGHEVGTEAILQTARSLGVESQLDPVPSLSLGVSELSPIELLRMYATIANHGTQEELTVIRGITLDNGDLYIRFFHRPLPAIDPAAADLLSHMLQTVFAEGTARSAYRLGFDRPAAGKTGTTSHHRDSWFAGFTPELTTVVWVGMDQPPAATPDGKKGRQLALTGATSALPIWVEFMKQALEGEPPTEFPASPYLIDVPIDIRTGKRADVECPSTQVVVEKYVRGREPMGGSCEPLWPASEPQVMETSASSN